MQNREVEIYNNIMDKIDRIPQKRELSLSGFLGGISNSISLSYSDIFKPLRKVVICTFVFGFFTGFLIITGSNSTITTAYEVDWLSNPESEFQLFL